MAEVDISKITYKIYLLRENGEQLNITDISQNVGWEENEGELAMRVSLTLANIIHNGKRISSLAKPNCQIIITAESGSTKEEVARGKIMDWSPTRSASTEAIELGGYDDLYDLQASQDNRYISAGVSTKTALTSIFKDWGIPVAKYEGPTNSNAKTTFKNEYLSDIILELLQTAYKHGAKECIVRANKGKVSVVPKASNTTVYCFEEEQNLEMTKYKISTGDMVTVVKVVATEDKSGRQKVEAVINGKTQYGKRQRIYIRDDDDTLATATAAAKEILAKEGKPQETFSLKAPDVPFIRKGDKIKVKTRVYSGYAIVKSVQHNASSQSMSLGIEKYDPTAVKKETQTAKAKKEYKVGDICTFAGGYHYYTSMDTKSRGGLRKGGPAWIQNINPKGKHKYALIGGAYKSGVGGSSNVYGWVDENTVS